MVRRHTAHPGSSRRRNRSPGSAPLPALDRVRTLRPGTAGSRCSFGIQEGAAVVARVSSGGPCAPSPCVCPRNGAERVRPAAAGTCACAAPSPWSSAIWPQLCRPRRAGWRHPPLRRRGGCRSAPVAPAAGCSCHQQASSPRRQSVRRPRATPPVLASGVSAAAGVAATPPPARLGAAPCGIPPSWSEQEVPTTNRARHSHAIRVSVGSPGRRDTLRSRCRCRLRGDSVPREGLA